MNNENNVRIHIDQRPYESPSRTTGEALYALGRIAEDLELFREVSGDKEDPSIPNGPETIHLTQDQHFHSGPTQNKEFSIIVNGRKKKVHMKTLSFNEVVDQAFDPVPTGPNILFTITYRNGPHANSEGILVEGGVVTIKDGMIFNVTTTDKS